MGNINASSQPNPSDPFSTFNPENTVQAEEKLENPGSMEELHKKCKEIFPVNFEGAKIAVQKGLSNHFQISHSLTMSSLAPSGYRFGATYVGTKQYGPGEAYPVLVGDIDPVGNLNANIYHKFSDNIMAKLQAQVQSNHCTASQYVLDYRGSNFTTTFTLANPDPTTLSGVFVAHYLQSITKNTDVGVELAVQRSVTIPGSQVALASVAARYTELIARGTVFIGGALISKKSTKFCDGSDYVASATAGASGLHLCYYQKASPQLQLGVELETSFRLQESSAAIGYQVDLPKADLVFKGMVDTNWNVGATLDKKLTPMPFSLTLSGMLNHQKNQFRLGFGFVIG